MKTECLILNVGEIELEASLALYGSLLPDYRKNKIAALKLEADKRLSLGVGILLEYIIKKEEISNGKIIFNEYGKPSLEGNPFYFNFSHSGSLAVAVKSPHPVGIDTEQIRAAKFDAAKRFFSEREREFIRNGIPLDFFRVWTRKESYSKLRGIGLGGMTDCEVIPPSPLFEDFSFFEKEHLGNLITVCANRGENPIFSVVPLNEISKHLLEP